MKLINISLLSIRRQWGKRLFLLTALGVSLAAVLILMTLVQSQQRSLERQFDEYGANIVILPRQDGLSLSYGGLDITSVVTEIYPLHIEDIQNLSSIPNSRNLRAVSTKLIGAVMAGQGSDKRNILLVGVDFEQERMIKNWWNLTGEYPSGDNEILAGSGAAALWGLSPGDSLEVQGNIFSVSGVLDETGSQDDGILLVSRSSAETVLNRPGEVSLVDVSALCRDCPIDELVSQISTVLPGADVKALRHIMDQRMEVMERFGHFVWGTGIFIVLLCGFLVLSLTTASVSERHREIGIFRALGFSSGNILSIIMSETFILSVAAGGFGLILTFLLGKIFLPTLTGLKPEDILFPPLLYLSGFIIQLLLALAASLPPAFKAARIDPVQSIAGL